MSNILLFTGGARGGERADRGPADCPASAAAPLPRPDRDGGYDASHPAPFANVLAWDPPATRDYLRADLWGVEMPGAPMIAGWLEPHPIGS